MRILLRKDWQQRGSKESQILRKNYSDNALSSIGYRLVIVTTWPFITQLRFAKHGMQSERSNVLMKL